jgi:hypothetical protein
VIRAEYTNALIVSTSSDELGNSFVSCVLDGSSPGLGFEGISTGLVVEKLFVSEAEALFELGVA